MDIFSKDSIHNDMIEPKVHTGLHKIARRLKRTDLIVMRAIRKLECSTLTLLMRLLTKLGDPAGWSTVSIGIMIWDGQAGGVGLQIGLTSLGAAFVAKAFKHSCRRTRPCLHQSFPKALVTIPDRWSFPSGHTTSAFAVALFLIAGAMPAAPLFTVLAVGIAFSRVYLGVHFPSDVVGGMSLGALFGLLIYPLMSLV